MGNLKRISYAAPFTATVTVNPLGEVSSERGDGVGGYNYSACSYNFDVSHGDLRCCKGFKRYGVPDYPAKPLKIYFYKRFNAAGEVDDRILFYCANNASVSSGSSCTSGSTRSISEVRAGSATGRISSSEYDTIRSGTFPANPDSNVSPCNVSFGSTVADIVGDSVAGAPAVR